MNGYGKGIKENVELRDYRWIRYIFEYLLWYVIGCDIIILDINLFIVNEIGNYKNNLNVLYIFFFFIIGLNKMNICRFLKLVCLFFFEEKLK